MDKHLKRYVVHEFINSLYLNINKKVDVENLIHDMFDKAHYEFTDIGANNFFAVYGDVLDDEFLISRTKMESYGEYARRIVELLLSIVCVESETIQGLYNEDMTICDRFVFDIHGLLVVNNDFIRAIENELFNTLED